MPITSFPASANMYDGSGNPLSSHYNSATDEYVLNVHDADVHYRIVNKYLRQDTGVSTNINIASAVNDYIITVDDTTGFIVGNYLHINTTSAEPTHPIILAIGAGAPGTLTLDRRLDTAHGIGDEVLQTVVDMASLAGTLATPQVYFMGPEPGEVWHLTRILFEMTHTAAGDLGKFGAIAAPGLVNGMIVRAYVSGQYGTLTNWKANANIKTDMFNVEFDPRAGGGGTYGTTGRGTFKEAGAVLRLDGNLGDQLQIYIQDDLTPASTNFLTFTMKGQGHYET